MGHALGAPKVKKSNFGKLDNGRQCPYSASEKKVQKTKKFSLNELHLECAKIIDLRSKPGALEPKN